MRSSRTSRSALRAGVLVLSLALAGTLTAAAASADGTGTTPAPAASTTPAPAPTATASSSPTPAPSPSVAATPPTTPAPSASSGRTKAAAGYTPSCARMPAGSTTAYDVSYFNYPFSGSAARNRIRFMVLRAINSTPGCDVDTSALGYHWNSIRIAAFSLNDNTTVDALIRAARRGVSIRVITDAHNIRGPKATQSPSFKRLQRMLGVSTVRKSWARVCNGSCRGTGGNHHYKMYLFSHTGSKHFVTMAGSANLTMKASAGQWNHLDVYTNAQTYNTYGNIFTELTRDRPAQGVYRDYLTGAVRTWFFPRPGTSYANDPMVQALSKISCRGAGFGNGRTVVRIGMYAWYEERGLWMAQKVRQLWNAGCNVAIEYAVIGNNVKRIVYSPTGRGRIPMRQVATFYKDGTVADYDHQKYVTIAGRYAGRPKSVVTWTGTTNWSNLGLYSDDLTQVWSGDTKRAAAYRSAFYRVWRGPHTRVPSPTSALPGRVGQGQIKFGQGKYRNLEAN